MTGSNILKLMQCLKDHKALYPRNRYWPLYFILRKAFYLSSEWRELSRRVREEVGHCEINPKHKSQLHAHHRVPLATRPEYGLVRKYIACWCSRCHMKHHRTPLTKYPRESISRGEGVRHSEPRMPQPLVSHA